ncbi:MAG: LPS assembly lipoprotein LptE [Planctomycetota bacterium]|jgi:hypothetical protein|nr:LPS assembly lipoprotein LptE [Planctomycetota bacterium]
MFGKAILGLRRGLSRPAGAFFPVLLAAALLLPGCRTSTRSGLPSHLRTVEVHIFQNKTMYKGIEGTLARSVIDRVNMDPTIQAVSNGGDAVITGEIVSVTRSTLRETSSNEPGTVLVTINATYSFYDVKNRRYLARDAAISSSETGISSGVYEASRGGESLQGERGASLALAAEIVRRTIGMW